MNKKILVAATLAATTMSTQAVAFLDFIPKALGMQHKDGGAGGGVPIPPTGEQVIIRGGVWPNIKPKPETKPDKGSDKDTDKDSEK